MVAPLRVAAAVVLACVAVAGCDVFKRNEETVGAVNQRVIGMAAGDFFDRYGRPRWRAESSDGGAEYRWESPTGYLRAGLRRPRRTDLPASPVGRPRAAASRVDRDRVRRTGQTPAPRAAAKSSARRSGACGCQGGNAFIAAPIDCFAFQ